MCAPIEPSVCSFAIRDLVRVAGEVTTGDAVTENIATGNSASRLGSASAESEEVQAAA